MQQPLIYRFKKKDLKLDPRNCWLEGDGYFKYYESLSVRTLTCAEDRVKAYRFNFNATKSWVAPGW